MDKSDTKVKETVDNKQPENKKAEPQETAEQINWKKFREQREKERVSNEAAMKRAAEKEAEATALKAAMEALVSKQNYAQPTQSDPQEQTDEQRIAKLVDAKLAERERKYEQERQQREQAEYPQRLKSTYKDFESVCTAENIDYLEYHHPETAAALKALPDNFDTWSKIYNAVKRYVPNPDSKKDQNKADKNAKKPQSMAVPGSTPTGDHAPMKLDDQRRKDNWSRMQKVMKGG